MKNNKRKIRQEKLAKIFYEMGMELDVVSKISGVETNRLIKLVSKEKFKENY